MLAVEVVLAALALVVGWQRVVGLTLKARRFQTEAAVVLPTVGQKSSIERRKMNSIAKRTTSWVEGTSNLIANYAYTCRCRCDSQQRKYSL
jgi:hypothetical protein